MASKAGRIVGKILSYVPIAWRLFKSARSERGARELRRWEMKQRRERDRRLRRKAGR